MKRLSPRVVVAALASAVTLMATLLATTGADPGTGALATGAVCTLPLEPEPQPVCAPAPRKHS
jgi:hypothetical protein